MDCPVGYECVSSVKPLEDYTAFTIALVVIVVTITLALLINEIHARRSIRD